MATKLTEGGLRSPEAAKRLGIRGRDVYQLLFAGELDGGPGRDGMVNFDEASIDSYLKRHGFGVLADSSTAPSTLRSDTGDDAQVREDTSGSRMPSSEAQNDTGEDGPTPQDSGS